ncbi:MAG TPA: hypothetical protein VK607_18895 [Kofleriaceae bacterium]|nr:hypothetical protein [Kofleriaceae bacterium]
MNNLFRVLPFLVAIALTGCVASAPTPAESETDQAVASAPGAQPAAAAAQPVPRILRRGASLPAHLDAEFCEVIFGSCSMGSCEEPFEPVQNLSEICCNNGFCSVEYYRQCGGCNPESQACR